MPRTVIILNNPTLKVATDQAGLATGQAVECQVTSAVVTAQPKYQTIPPTGCAGETQSPGLTGWQLELAWLQDWGAPAPGGLSWFAMANDGKPVWFELTPDAANPSEKISGEAFATAGSYGGTFGDGSPAVATATWPLLNAPTIPAPAATAQAEAEQAEVPA